ncbi:hypothetical protein GCM10028856_19590 [Halopiger thermotolerans]
MMIAVVFAFVSAVSVSPLAPWDSVEPAFYVFVGLITGNITVITVVVSISQLLLSTELKTPDELRSQIDSATAYRDEVGDAVGRIPPVDPLEFLQLLFETVRRDAQRLGGLARSETSGVIVDDIDAAVTEVTDRATRVDTHLRTADTATIEALSATLTVTYADEIRHLRQIQSDYDERLPENVSEQIDALVDHLLDIDVARQYFKTIYLQEELAVLSRALVLAGLPALAVVVAGLLLFTASTGASVPQSALPVFLPAIVAIGFVPLAVLCAFVVRIATVSRQTAAMLPFRAPAQR